MLSLFPRTVAFCRVSALAVAGLVFVPSFSSARGDVALPAATQPDFYDHRLSVRLAFYTAADDWETLTGDPSVFRDAGRREQVRGPLVQVDRQWAARLAELGQLDPSMKVSSQDSTRVSHDPYLIAAGDAATTAAAGAAAASTDPHTAAMGKLKLLAGQWLAGADEAGQRKTVDALISLLKATDATDADFDAGATFFFGLPGTTPTATERLRAAIMGNRPSDTSRVVAAARGAVGRNGAEAAATEQAAASLLAALGGKAMVISGNTTDGKAFSTRDWKGKVVLVNFWDVQHRVHAHDLAPVYQKYHDQGLEMVGVCSDLQTDLPARYLKAEPLVTWVNLFDPEAAARKQPHPMAKQYGVNFMSPCFVVIDKGGVCRGVGMSVGEVDAVVQKCLGE